MSRYDLADDISGALETRDADERTRVLRALLVRPVLRQQDDPELVRAARRHADELRAWLEREVGWRLVVDTQAVRLLPSYVPHGPTGTAVAGHHPARARRADPPFTRRRYVLLCLALAVLERSDLQVALGRLADEIVLAARQPGLEEIAFTLTGREERGDLVAVIRLLVRYGVLVRVAGDEDSFVAAAGDALYDVDRRVMATLLATMHSPALVQRQVGGGASIDAIEAALHEQPPAYTDDEVNRRLRHAVSRRLLSDPVVYYDELPDDERAYLISQRVPLTRRLTEATGLMAELRAEGVALVDPDDQLTDTRMPDQGTDGHATLLLAEHLSTRGATDVRTLHTLTGRLAQEHASYWRKTTREPGAERGLVAEALDRLTGLGLVSVSGTGPEAVVTPLPALARFAVTAPTVRSAGR